MVFNLQTLRDLQNSPLEAYPVANLNLSTWASLWVLLLILSISEGLWISKAPTPKAKDH